MGSIVHGRTGPRTAKRAMVPGDLPDVSIASKGGLSCIPSVEHVVG